MLAEVADDQAQANLILQEFEEEDWDNPNFEDNDDEDYDIKENDEE